jgi:hypothetical protein
MKLIVTASLFTVLFLNACTTPPVPSDAPTPLPSLTFEHLNDIPVDVKQIDIKLETQRGANAWDVSSAMPTPPDIAIRRYLNERFKAKGSDGILKMTVKKADIFVEDVPHSNRLLSFIPFADQHDHTFEVILDIESQYNSGLPDSKTTTRFVRKIKLPPHVTMAYREAALQRAMEEMLVDIDEAIGIALSSEFALVDDKNIPQKSLPVKTELPEIETIYSVKGAVTNALGGDAPEWLTTRGVNE